MKHHDSKIRNNYTTIYSKIYNMRNSLLHADKVMFVNIMNALSITIDDDLRRKFFKQNAEA